MTVQYYFTDFVLNIELLQLLRDPVVQINRENAQTMNKESKEMKLEELRLLRDNWKENSTCTYAEHLDVLKVRGI